MSNFPTAEMRVNASKKQPQKCVYIDRFSKGIEAQRFCDENDIPKIFVTRKKEYQS